MAEGRNLVKLVRGDPENLSGDVIVYSKLNSPIEKRICCVYATNNYQKYQDIIQNKTFGEIEMTSRIFEELLGKKRYNFYFLFFDPILEKDKITSLCDVCESKDGHKLEECQGAVIADLTNYIDSYVHQLKRKLGESGHAHLKTEKSEYEEFLKSLKPEEQDRYIRLKQCIDQYIAADRDNYGGYLEEIEERIDCLCTGEDFFQSINKIKRVIHKCESGEDIQRSSSYIEELLKIACKNPKWSYRWGNPPKSPFD